MPVRVDKEIARRSIATRAQREIFLIEQTRPGTRCSIWFYKLIRGAFDVGVLASAIKHLTLRVPLLQTRFFYSDGELWQIRDRSIEHNLRTIDVSTHSTPLEDAMRRMRKAVNQSGGMTDDDELYEFTVYIIGNNEYVFYARFHHGIIDGNSWAKLESLLAAAYNDLKQGREIAVQTELHFDALSCDDATYQASGEYEKDKKFWQAYVQPLKRYAYTQRNINPVGKMTTYRHTMTLCTSEHLKLQQLAATLNISPTFLYIGVSALLLRNLLGREYVSLSLPVRGTYLTQELGMTSNVLPLLLQIPEHATICEVLLQISQETKSILKHQRYRTEDILKLADYSSNGSFGPYVNIMRFDHGELLKDCSCSSHFGGNIDISDLQITFWTDRSNNQLDILFDDIHEGHSEEQLAALKNHLTFILDQVLCEPNKIVGTLDERCRVDTNVELCESFYANRRRPIAAGFMQWSRFCDFLVRLVDSNTWVGSGPSPFAISKVLLADRVVGISKLECVTDSVCTKAPGTVVKINESAWHVAVADGVVKIGNFLDDNGQSILAQSLAHQCHINEGTQLPIITPEQAKRLSVALAQAMLSEPYWSQCLAHFEPCQLSFVQNSSIQLPVWAATSYQTSRDISVFEVLVAWLIYIARDTQKSQIQIGWDANGGWHQDNEASSTIIFARTVPFVTSIDLNDTFPEVVASVEKDYKQLVEQLPCLSDFFIRNAKNSIENVRGNKPWALAVSLRDKKNGQEYSMNDASEISEHAHGSLMTLQINKHNGAIRWIYDSNQITEEEVNNISSRLLVLLASAHSTDEANKKVANLNLLPKAERDLLLHTWNQMTVTNLSFQGLHQLFEAQVQLH